MNTCEGQCETDGVYGDGMGWCRFSRRYVRQLRAEGVNVTLSEVPRMEHWW